MKKFFAFILVLALLAGGYLVVSGQIRLTNTDIEEETKSVYSSAKAENVSVPMRADQNSGGAAKDETALNGAKRIDDQIWSAMRNGNVGAAKTILIAMGCDEAGAGTWISGHQNAASAMNKRYVHVLAEAGNVCVAEVVHYLVTFTNGRKDWNESNSGYWLYMRKTNGKWEPSVLTDEETELLNKSYYQHFKPEAIEAVTAGRNMADFGNKMWTHRDGVEEGIFTTNVAYMYQAENGDITVMVAVANGTNVIKRLKKLDVTITDDKLGQVLKVSEKCNLSVLPGTVEIYEIKVPAGKVKKGTWTTMHSDVHNSYD